MTLTRDANETVNARVLREPEFAATLLNEAIKLFLNDEPATARLLLRSVFGTKPESFDIERFKPSKNLF
jgi:hypothetical protein